jgi:hypothetical protein
VSHKSATPQKPAKKASPVRRPEKRPAIPATSAAVHQIEVVHSAMAPMMAMKRMVSRRRILNGDMGIKGIREI